MVIAEIYEQAARRVLERCERLAALSALPDGILRAYLTPEQKQANAQVGQWLTEAGMSTWLDAVGNIWGRYEGKKENAPALILGSHLDTVPYAGRYDGILGVLNAIELVHMLHEQGRHLPFAIEVVGFCDEEGTRFGSTLIGSKSVAGHWQDDWLALEDDHGITLAKALHNFGLDPNRCATAGRHCDEVIGYWEVHIEQGPVLEAEDLPLGVVTGIAGARRSNIRVSGQAGHSGTTPMHLRKDALAGAADIILAIENTAKKFGGDVVATVGQVFARPGAVNVIAGDVILSLDVRSQNDTVRDQVLLAINDSVEAIVALRGLTFSWAHTHSAPAVLCDGKFQAIFADAIAATTHARLASKFLPSGAGHDAMAMADLCPVAMLFVRSPGGISHHPDEGVIPQDVSLSLSVMMQALESYAATAEFSEFLGH
ncbi:allantoate amidohydrolase [Halioxenophilus aromaticivorans]|uniref:Allantoate amidohydrolase n=1 Tax=Halioxenophilus aromaticivorans TaxID=1306992 RepID=A0AAV3U5Q1_9ALTE